MQPFAEKYINEAYRNTKCYQCNRSMSAGNTTLKSIIKGKQKYNKPVCDSCSKGGNVIILKSKVEDEEEEKSIGSEGTPSTKFTVRASSRVSQKNQNAVAVRPSRRRKFL